MHVVAQTRTYTLGGDDIDRFSAWLMEVQDGLGIDRQNQMRVRLLMEEVLLVMRERLGEDACFQASCESPLGHPRLRLKLEGAPFNPLGTTTGELGEWDSSLRTAIGLSPQYAYEGGHNVLRLTLPHQHMNPVARIAIAILLGLGFGVLGSLIPLSLREAFVDIFLTPTYDMWSRILNAISGPIIFCTVLTTMLNTRRIEESGGSSVLVIVRYFALSLLVVGGALLCALPLFSLSHVDITVDQELGRDLLNVLLQVVPANIVDPFVGSNTSQLLFLAFALGCLLVRLGGQVDGLKGLVRQANMVGLQAADWVSWLVPIFVGAFLCLELWKGQVDVLEDVWRPLLLSLVISSVTVLVIVVILSRRLRVAPSLLLAKLREPFLVALRTGSLDESFTTAQHSCTRLLGIDAGYVRVGLPQGLVLYMPVSAIGTVVFTLFVAREFGVQANTLWYISAIVIAVVVFVATPPVPGANLLAYVVLFSTLGISSDALLDAMVFDIVFGIFAGAANQAMLQLEMTLQADRFGLLDRDRLRSDIA